MSEAYQPKIKPLDVKIRTLLKQTGVIDGGAYQPKIKPLDASLIRVVLPNKYETQVNGGAYQPKIKPLDVRLRRLLIEYVESGTDAYQSKIKPLDITLIKG